MPTTDDWDAARARVQRELKNNHKQAAFVPPAFADFNGTWIRMCPLAVVAFFPGEAHPDGVTVVSLENGATQRVAMPVAEFAAALDAALHGPPSLTESTS